MKALITGGNGFIGRHLTKLLKSKNIQVFKFIGDLKEEANVRKNVFSIKPDWIFHLASPILRSDKLLDLSLAENLAVDLFGTVYLLQAAAGLAKKPKILITGTAAVYAGSAKPLRENFPLQPLTGYGLSKLTQELICRQLAESYNLPVIFTRSFLLIGPGQKPGFAVTDIAREIAAGAKSITLGNPKIKRDFTDVRDAGRAYYLLMTKGKPGEIYNVCSGRTFSIGKIAKKLAALSGRPITFSQKTAWRRNDLKSIAGDNTKLARLGWQPQISLIQSLKDTLNYWRKP